MNSYNLPAQAIVSVSIKSDTHVSIESNDIVEQLFIDANGTTISMSGSYNRLKQFKIINSGNRAIFFIRSEMFPELTLLSITSCNHLVDVILIGPFNKLISANLADNAITNFSVNNDNFPALCCLNLKNNKMTDFNYDSESLIDIDLSNNNISKFEIKKKNKIASLDISNNLNIILSNANSISNSYSMLHMNIKGSNFTHAPYTSLAAVFIKHIIYDGYEYHCNLNKANYAIVDEFLQECRAKARFADDPPAQIIHLVKDDVFSTDDVHHLNISTDITNQAKPSLISKILAIINKNSNPINVAKAFEIALLSQTLEPISMSDASKLDLIKVIADNSAVSDSDLVSIAKAIDDKY